MQTVQLKYDIISWITRIDDKKLIIRLHEWVEQQKYIDKTKQSNASKSLTEGYGIWADDDTFDETNYRDQLWQPQKNVW